MIIIKNLTKRYKNADKLAVKNLNLTINDGEVFGFIGENGAGKSTTIKCITGILPYSEGSIEVAGYDLAKNPIEAKKNIGYVSDNHSVYDKLTGREYVNFLANIYGVSKADRDRRLNDLAIRFNLQDKLDTIIKSYSHGMKQKICVIGALIHEPKVWILDEPLTGLDPKSAKELKELMREHCDKGNVVFFSSHVLEVVEKLCDRIAIIKNGEIIATFTMAQLEEQQQGKSLEDFFFEITENNGTGTVDFGQNNANNASKIDTNLQTDTQNTQDNLDIESICEEASAVVETEQKSDNSCGFDDCIESEKEVAESVEEAENGDNEETQNTACKSDGVTE